MLSRHSLLLGSFLLTAIALPLRVDAITIGSAFGPAGEGGTDNGQSISVGAGGEVFELDAFVGIAGSDLNGAFDGTTAQLSLDPLPVDIGFAFSSSLSADTTDLVLRYEITNGTGADLGNLSVMSFLDAEIDELTNSFFNEYVSTSGAAAAGQSWEADEPGYLFGDIYSNLQNGTLDGTNGVPESAPDDVSLALGFDVGVLAAGDKAIFEFMISEDEDQLGGFALHHHDSDPGSPTTITFSGQASVVPFDPGDPGGPGTPIPEPGSALVYGLGLLIVGARVRRLPRS